MTTEGNWAVEGYDTFEGGADADYRVKDGLGSEAEALVVATNYMIDLERRQPTASSGGQDPYGIQDRVFIVRPDGSKYQFYLPQA
jgi:hypothetical protein